MEEGMAAMDDLKKVVHGVRSHCHGQFEQGI